MLTSATRSTGTFALLFLPLLAILNVLGLAHLPTKPNFEGFNRLVPPFLSAPTGLQIGG